MTNELKRIETDRRDLLLKMSTLQQTIDNQSLSIAQLNDITAKLAINETRLARENESRQIEKEISRNLVAALEQDKSMTTSLLCEVVNKYIQQISENGLLKQQLVSNLSVTANSSFLASSQTFPGQMVVDSNRMPVKDSNAGADMTAIEYDEEQSFNRTSAMAPGNEITEEEEGFGRLISSNKTSNRLLPSNALALNQTLSQGSSFDGLDASSSVFSISKQTMASKLLDKVHSSRSMNQPIHDDDKLWKQVLDRYRYQDESAIHIQDSRLSLKQIARLWIRLGRAVLADYRNMVPKQVRILSFSIS